MQKTHNKALQLTVKSAAPNVVLLFTATELGVSFSMPEAISQYQGISIEGIMNKSKAILLLSCCVAFNAIAAEQCETNFTKEGSFFKGKTFKTWSEVEGVSSADAYSFRVSLEVASLPL